MDFTKDGVGTFDAYCKASGINGPIENLKPDELAGLIDHTLLKPEGTVSEVEKLCEEAKKYHFKSVCVNPYMVPFADGFLRGSTVLVCTVIGFPLGATSTSVKAFETEDAVKSGADEIDMVLNIGALKEKEYGVVEMDIREVVKASGNKLVKVILETCLLNDEEIEKASVITKNSGASYVKTSTGFSSGGATIEAIKIMRKSVGDDLGVKASGGVRDLPGLISMVNAGATRIGASAGVAIVTGADPGEGKY